MTIKVGIVGGTGYTGIELLRILLPHPLVTVAMVTSRTEAGKRLDAFFPSLRGLTDLCFSDQDINALKSCQVVFFATPHGVAMQAAAELTQAGVKIIDLAADFRLQNTAVFSKWYGMEHSCPDLLADAVYGLPEYNRAQVAKASIIGNPGCYPTTVQLGLLPLIINHATTPLIQTDDIIVDAKSGISGAGRKAEISLLASEASDNFKAYSVSGHRHQPEIAQGLAAISQGAANFDSLIFIPHLVPMIRGMLSTIYVTLTEAGSATDLQALFEQHYASEPFVDVMPAGSSPETRSTRGSNMLRIALHKVSASKAVILVAQDNLVKGAAGQAVQNMNVLLGLPETTGLTAIAVSP